MNEERNEAMENQELTFDEPIKAERASSGFKGKAIAFVAGVIACGVGTLVYNHKKNKEMVEIEEEFDEDFDDFEEEALEDLEAEVNKDSEEK